MLSDRSTKTLMAVFALVAGILLTVKYIIDDTPFREWWFAGVLFIIAAALWIWMWQEDQKALTSSRTTAPDRAKVAAKAVAKAEAAVTKARDAVPAAPVVEKATPPAKESAPAKEKPKPAEQKPAPVAKKPAPAKSKEVVSDEVDDLTRIEGIGPKYREALLAAGIQTFDQLARASADELGAIIKGAKMRRPASMATWAEQASYAARDDWEGLDKLQSQLKGGRR